MNTELQVNRDFKGIWITKEIWLHPTLSMQAKILWAEIDSLFDSRRGGCFASDDYLMKFIGVKVSRLHEIMRELKAAGLLERVSFDGRNRVIKAINPNNVIKIQETAKQDSGYPHVSTAENRSPDSRETAHPTYNREISIYLREENNSLPSSETSPADAGNRELSSFKKSAFTEEVVKVTEEFRDVIVQEKPHYSKRDDFAQWLKPIDEMLNKNKIPKQQILKVLRWAILDKTKVGNWTGWSNKFFQAKNIAQYLLDKFDGVESSMQVKEPRVFSPCGDMDESLDKLKQMKRDAL